MNAALAADSTSDRFAARCAALQLRIVDLAQIRILGLVLNSDSESDLIRIRIQTRKSLIEIQILGLIQIPIPILVDLMSIDAGPHAPSHTMVVFRP